MRIRLIIPALGLFACQPQRRAAAPLAIDSTRLGQARTAAAALGTDLMAMLTQELARGGPAAAIAVCADSAQVRTSRHQQSGITVRRVGTRVRNSANAPDPLEAAVLAAFEAALAAGRLPPDTAIVEALPGGHTRLRYLRPVRIQEACLNCHGPSSGIPESVRALLAERYPNDQATGYALGDLRGAVTVQIAQD